MKKIILSFLLALTSYACADYSTTYKTSSELGLLIASGDDQAKSVGYGLTYQVVSDGDRELGVTIHDRYYQDSVVDAWDISDGVYGANAGSFVQNYSSGPVDMALWNLDVYVKPIPDSTGFENISVQDGSTDTRPKISGTVDFQSFTTGSYYDNLIVFAFDETLVEAIVVDEDTYYDSIGSFDSKNMSFADVQLDGFDPTDEGIYTITLTLHNEGYANDLISTIQVIVGNPPAVPAPGALLLGGIGTVLAGRIRRKYA